MSIVYDYFSKKLKRTQLLAARPHENNIMADNEVNKCPKSVAFFFGVCYNPKAR